MAQSERLTIAQRILSDALLVIGVGLLAMAAGLWLRSQQRYERVEQAAQVFQEYALPPASEPERNPPTVDWAGLQAVNPQVVGWVSIPNTVINYPVCQAADNEYYLHRAPDRTENDGGSIFLDCDNTAPGMLERQTIIYGHHMKNGVMFKQVADFNNQAFFDAVPTVWYCTPQATYRCAPLCLYYAEPDDQTVRRFSFETNEDYAAYLSSMLAKAVTRAADAEVRAAALPQIFTLCTCNYIEGQGRSVLVCTVEQTV